MDALTECSFCVRTAAPDAPPGGWVYETELFRASVSPGMSIPGWLVLHTVRHTEGLAGLNSLEQAELGVAVQALAATMVRRSGEPSVYMYAMCERVRHFHIMIGAPPPGVSERGGSLLIDVLKRESSLVDPSGVVSAAEEIGQLLLNAEP